VGAIPFLNLGHEFQPVFTKRSLSPRSSCTQARNELKLRIEGTTVIVSDTEADEALKEFPLCQFLGQAHDLDTLHDIALLVQSLSGS
jgi:hypothetical protein